MRAGYVCCDMQKVDIVGREETWIIGHIGKLRRFRSGFRGRQQTHGLCMHDVPTLAPIHRSVSNVTKAKSIFSIRMESALHTVLLRFPSAPYPFPPSDCSLGFIFLFSKACRCVVCAGAEARTGAAGARTPTTARGHTSSNTGRRDTRSSAREARAPPPRTQHCWTRWRS